MINKSDFILYKILPFSACFSVCLFSRSYSFSLPNFCGIEEIFLAPLSRNPPSVLRNSAWTNIDVTAFHIDVSNSIYYQKIGQNESLNIVCKCNKKMLVLTKL